MFGLVVMGRLRDMDVFGESWLSSGEIWLSDRLLELRSQLALVRFNRAAVGGKETAQPTARRVGIACDRRVLPGSLAVWLLRFANINRMVRSLAVLAAARRNAAAFWS